VGYTWLRAAPRRSRGERGSRSSRRGRRRRTRTRGGYWWQILAGSARAWGVAAAGHMDFLCRIRFSLRFSRHKIEGKGKTQRQGDALAAPTPLCLDLSRWIAGRFASLLISF
jgi:hypothetical protein